METKLINISWIDIQTLQNLISRKNKWIGISAAVFLSVCLLARETIQRPPKNLRHIPYHSYFDAFWSSLRGESYYKISDRTILPYINSKNKYSGMYNRIGRAGWTVHITDPETIKYVLMKHELYPRLEPHPLLEETMAGKFFELPGLLFSRGKEWKDQRIATNPFIRRERPVELFGKTTSKLFQVMPSSNEVDIKFWLHRLVFDIIGVSLLGVDYDTLNNNNIEFMESVDTINTQMQKPIFFNFPHFELFLKSYMPQRLQIFKDIDVVVKNMKEFVLKRIEDVKNGNYYNPCMNGEKDLLTIIVEGFINNNDNLITEDMLVDNTQFMVTTAHAAVHATLQYAMYYLAKYPEFQTCAREEVISVLGDAKDNVLPTPDQLNQLPYINQILKETMRLSASIAQSIPRITQCDSVLNGIFIPEGAVIQLDIHNVHNSERLWKNPSEFIPDRFSPDGEAYALRGEGMKYLPFGGGTRQCLGMKYALSLQIVVLAMMVRKYRWSLPKNDVHKDSFDVSGIVTVAPNSMSIFIEEKYY